MYIINIKNKDGETGTIVPDIGFKYAKNLHDINKGEIKLSGTGVIKRGLLGIGSEITIYRNGVIDFLGVVDYIDKLDGGTISATYNGYEWWLTKEKYPTTKVWKNTNILDIFLNVINQSSKMTYISIPSAFNIDYKVNETDSLWGILVDLVKIAGWYMLINYGSKAVDIYSSLTDISGAVLNDGLQISNVRYTEGYPQGNHIIVYGKGDGEKQIKEEAEDATSIGIYSRITKIITNRSVISPDEAQTLANAELNIYKNPTQVYDFDLINPYTNISSGGIVTINSNDKDINSVDVRVVSVERGERNSTEYCSVQVTNKGYDQKLKQRNNILGEFIKRDVTNNTFMQGSSNSLTFEGMINSNNTYPLRVGMYIPDNYIKDEAGNYNVLGCDISYEVEKYRSGIGTSSSSSNTTGVSTSNTSNLTNLSVSNAQGGGGGSTSDGYYFGGYEDTFDDSDTGTDKWTDASGFINIGSGNFLFHSIFVSMTMIVDAGAGFSWNNLVRIRAINEDDNTYYPSSAGVAIGNRFSAQDITGIVINGYLHIPINWRNAKYYLQFNVTTDSFMGTGINSFIRYSYFGANSHTHSASTSEANHNHTSSVSDGGHGHSVTIGSGATDAGSVNATQISSIKLMYWNGSAWVLKNEIVNTNKILDYDVDISDGGTYPDVGGYWRVELYTNNSNPDLVKSVINVKHRLDG